MENRNYGRLYGEPQRFEYAPRSFKENGSVTVPKIDDDLAYFQRGWFKIVDVKPTINPDSQTLRLSGYDENKKQKIITFLYEIEEKTNSRPVRKIYSKLRLTVFCMEHGIWNDVKSKLEETGYWDLFLMAQRFANDDDYFNRGIAMFREYLADKVEDVDKTIAQALAYAFDGEEPIAG